VKHIEHRKANIPSKTPLGDHSRPAVHHKRKFTPTHRPSEVNTPNLSLFLQGS